MAEIKNPFKKVARCEDLIDEKTMKESSSHERAANYYLYRMIVDYGAINNTIDKMLEIIKTNLERYREEMKNRKPYQNN